jgi:hypothetical protein
MDTLMKADIFFVVTTVAVILVTAGVLVSLYYVVRAVKHLEGLSEVTQDIRESFIFNLLFKRNGKHRKK